VPEEARMPCSANDLCLLCAADGDTFGLPMELQYMWTQTLPHGELDSMFPASEPVPTGAAFDDREWPASVDEGAHIGSWSVLQPIDAQLGDPRAFFCEPGPNLYLRGNVRVDARGFVMSARRMPAELVDLVCPDPFCPSGPYAACDATSAPTCPYGEAPEHHGYGDASQLDRVLAVGASEQATYGYGRYRIILSASGPTVNTPVSGTVYAFFSQSNAYCDAAAPNVETNTAEIDVEISSSTDGTSGERDYCAAGQMCFIVSTWSSSTQGLPYGTGVARHETSAFRYRDRETAAASRTYGYDWREGSVRFTYDVDPDDCDEAAGSCPAERGSIAICEHRRFVPRRPSPIHLQVWPAWWAGIAPPGTVSEMTVHHVWHTPFAP